MTWLLVQAFCLGVMAMVALAVPSPLTITGAVVLTLVLAYSIHQEVRKEIKR